MKGIDVCISFDTTGSMYPCLTQVRRNIRSMVEQLFTDLPDIRIGLIAHGDYCDKNDPYDIRFLDLTTNERNIYKFMDTAEATYGGDFPECYEYALATANTFDWRDDREKVLIVIGDAPPHSIEYKGNTEGLDWTFEAQELGKKGVKIYAVHAMASTRQVSKEFYERIARYTGGEYLTLEQFSLLPQLIMAVCYKQQSMDALDSYANTLKASGQSTYQVRVMINRIAGGNAMMPTYANPDAMTPVAPARFQVLPVTSEESIKDFISNQGVTFKTGRGFYQLTKPESVSTFKEVIAVEKATGFIFTGDELRLYLGLSPQTYSKNGAVKEKLTPKHDAKYDIFVQSTSVGRKLTPGTSLLYEVPDWKL